MGCQEIAGKGKEELIRPKQIYIHELPHTEMVKSGIIRLATGRTQIARLNTPSYSSSC